MQKSLNENPGLLGKTMRKFFQQGTGRPGAEGGLYQVV
jgi:hypothetical protein